MKLLLRLCGLLLVLACLPALAQSSVKVFKIEIKHVGPQSVSDDLIRANIRVKPGDAYIRGTIDEDIRTLYATGQFYDIRVNEDNGSDGVTLTYVLQGNPRLVAIKFNGNKKYKDAKLLKKATSKTGEPLNERELFTDSQEMQKMYQKAGLPRHDGQIFHRD